MNFAILSTHTPVDLVNLKTGEDTRLFSIETNVITNFLVKIRIRKGVNLCLYTAAGRVLHRARYAPGTQLIEICKSATGTCWLEGDGQIEKLMIY